VVTKLAGVIRWNHGNLHSDQQGVKEVEKREEAIGTRIMEMLPCCKGYKGYKLIKPVI